jgi:hypothetical protein
MIFVCVLGRSGNDSLRSYLDRYWRGYRLGEESDCFWIAYGADSGLDGRKLGDGGPAKPYKCTDARIKVRESDSR